MLVIGHGVCEKLLLAYLKEIVPILERLSELPLDEETKRKLHGISSAITEQVLAPVRKCYQL